MSSNSLILQKRAKTYSLAGLFCIALSSCASKPTEETVVDQPLQSQEQAVSQEKVADRPFSAETLYALLTAEMAIDRKRYDVALGNYVQQAVSTRDPGVVAKAAHITSALKAHNAALEMAQLWLELEPDNTEAVRILSTELVTADRLDEALEQSKKLLQKGLPTAFDALAVKVASNNSSKIQSLSGEYAQLLEQHPNNTQLLIGYSILQQKSGQPEDALKTIKKAAKLEPKNLRALFQETRLLQQLDKKEEAVAKLEQMVEDNPENLGLRLRYAQSLAEVDLKAAKEQFQILYQSAPNNPGIIMSLGLVEKELGQYESAIERFRLLLLQQQNINSAHYHLGKTFDRLQMPEEALQHYLQVTPSQHFLESISRATEILVNSEREFEAIQNIREHKKNSKGRLLESLFIIESEVLTSIGQQSASELVINEGIEQFPQSTKLLYARAMIHVKNNYISGAESDLKRILEITPNNPAALNALGYTLVDQTNRFEEAETYIRQAHKLTPNNPAVLDSVGWLEYRKGNHSAALKMLRQAMQAMPDHEIAAHLGEVLWVSGKKDEAKRVWRSGLELNKHSEVIYKTLHRLDVEL
ncbi:tetratricopeptide repeat protein [Teredinibacter sp. KSP-S5-2]|uniref:tetratricopeptide repeat protein n=1 Tax=Teredinibacter sp. KSP-S5-2 TaxID=3034506 RepID=UPI002934D37A|nr:tetratricopeptide repeat protein [Teredinibacter sp. KSP-S5-2]WNO09563.1 tetratricopeptide repeat protein [Teredinibacter sp. KSP-S5-2]